MERNKRTIGYGPAKRLAGLSQEGPMAPEALPKLEDG